jgi:hypothetical protein
VGVCADISSPQNKTKSNQITHLEIKLFTGIHRLKIKITDLCNFCTNFLYIISIICTFSLRRDSFSCFTFEIKNKFRWNLHLIENQNLIRFVVVINRLEYLEDLGLLKGVRVIRKMEVNIRCARVLLDSSGSE